MVRAAHPAAHSQADHRNRGARKSSPWHRRRLCDGCWAGSTSPPQTQLAGEEGLLEALAQLEGFEAPAIEWERTLLPARVADYDPRWLDRLCLSGAVGWGQGFAASRVCRRRRGRTAPRDSLQRSAHHVLCARLGTVAGARSSRPMRGGAQTEPGIDARRTACVGTAQTAGSRFVEDIQRLLGLTRHQTHSALWELAAAGLAAADGFDQLRAMIDPERKPAAVAAHRKMRSAAGRWSLFSADIAAPSDALEKARRDDAAIESAARMLLARYGVVFRDLVARESNVPKWGVLLRMLRRLEDQRRSPRRTICQRLRRRAIRASRGRRKPSRRAVIAIRRERLRLPAPIP